MSNSNSVIAPKHLTVRVQKNLRRKKVLHSKWENQPNGSLSPEEGAQTSPSKVEWGWPQGELQFRNSVSKTRRKKKKNKDSFPKALKLL